MLPFSPLPPLRRHARLTASVALLLLIVIGFIGAPGHAQTVKCRITSLGASIVAGYYMPGVVAPYGLTDEITMNDPSVVGAQASGQGLWWPIQTADNGGIQLPPPSFNTQGQPIVTLSPPSGYNLSVTRGAGNSSGFFVGYGLSGTGANPLFTACYWDAVKPQRTATALGPLVAGYSTRAYAMADIPVTNPDLTVSIFTLAIGQASQGASNNDTAVFWRIAQNPASVPRADAVPTALPPLSAKRYCAAFGVSSMGVVSGPVVVGESDQASPSQRHAVAWDFTGLGFNPDPTQAVEAMPVATDLNPAVAALGNPPGLPTAAGAKITLLSSSAYAASIQSDGTILIAGSATYLTRQTKMVLGFRNPVTLNVTLPVAVLWSKAPGAAGYAASFPLGGMSAPSVARSVNSKGQIVGYMFTGTGTAGFVWDNVSKTQTIAADTASGTNWIVTDLQAINNTGQIIGTAAYRNSANIYGVLLTPNPTDAMP